MTSAAPWMGATTTGCYPNSALVCASTPCSPLPGGWCRTSARCELISAERSRTSCTGSGVRVSPMAGVKALSIPLPPRAEQGRFVAALDEHLSRLDAVAHALTAARERLTGLDRSVLDDAQSMGPEVRLEDVLVDIEAGSFKTPGRRASPAEWGVIKVSAMTWGQVRETGTRPCPVDNASTIGTRSDPGMCCCHGPTPASTSVRRCWSKGAKRDFC